MIRALCLKFPALLGSMSWNSSTSIPRGPSSRLLVVAMRVLRVLLECVSSLTIARAR